MEDLNTIHEIYKAEGYLYPGMNVLDLGSHDGKFAEYAEELGAKVYRIDIRGGKKCLPVGVGKMNCIAKIEGHGTGAHLIYDGIYDRNVDTLVPVFTLQTILNFLGSIDVIKCDIEGSEYEIFTDVDLRFVRYIAIEFHVWTEPYQPQVEGLGVRTGRFPTDGLERIIEHIGKTHKVEVVGDRNAGGYIYATLK